MKKVIKQFILIATISGILYLIAYFFLSFFLDKKLIFKIFKWGGGVQLFLFCSNFIIEYVSNKIS